MQGRKSHHATDRYILEEVCAVRVILPEGGTVDVEKERMVIRALLAELRINPLEVLVARNGTIVPEDAEARAGDEIRIITVKSGG
jgi:sulfur carrier protein